MKREALDYIRNIAVKNIPNTIKNEHSEILWKQIAGMRDKLIHGYFIVDMTTLWKTATQDVVQFKKAILKIADAWEKH